MALSLYMYMMLRQPRPTAPDAGIGLGSTTRVGHRVGVGRSRGMAEAKRTEPVTSTFDEPTTPKPCYSR